jgi:hypothetical protein
MTRTRIGTSKATGTIVVRPISLSLPGRVHSGLHADLGVCVRPI